MTRLSNELVDGDRYPADWEGVITYEGESIQLYAKVSRLPDADGDLILDMKWSGVVSPATREWIEVQTDLWVGVSATSLHAVCAPWRLVH